MELILFGVLSIGLGLSIILARDFWWELQKFGNQMKGQASERTAVWDVSNVLVGVVVVVLGLYLIWQGAWLISQPVVPSICNVPTGLLQAPNYDRYVQTGCAAAEKKDYQTALINFKQASAELDRKPYLSSYRERTTKAIQQMEQQLGVTR